jgi:hypothetical protein
LTERARLSMSAARSSASVTALDVNHEPVLRSSAWSWPLKWSAARSEARSWCARLPRRRRAWEGSSPLRAAATVRLGRDVSFMA